MDLHNLLKQLVWWGPTVLFLITIISSFLIGYRRGFRKSLILFVNAFIILVLCVTLYLCLVNVEQVDVILLKIVNFFMGGGAALQNALGVSASCKTLHEVILEAIPRNMNYVDGLSLILQDNGQYLSTLVDLSYRIIFGLVIYILYHILVFFGYIGYLFFFREGRFKKKTEEEFLVGESQATYHKRGIGGGFIGLSRGVVKALVNISFLGMIFFIISGGIGEREPSNIDLGDKQLNYVVDAYDSIGSYGTKGIFKVLNMCKDSNDVPYYLFAADLVFQGKLEDPNRHINETNIYFRNELSAYTKFTRDTAELLLKYGDKDIRNAILYGTDDIFEILNPIFTNPSFQDEFRQLIYEFDMGTYFINLTLSLGVSIARHLNDTTFMNGLDPVAGEILSILFNENYHCSVIPYEASLSSDVILPTIDSTVLITREDVNTIYEILICYFNKSQELNGPSVDYTKFGIELTKEIVPFLSDLSILRTSNKDKLDPVLKRIYAYVNYKFLNGNGELNQSVEVSQKFYISEEYENISWIEEIDYLLGMCDEIIDLYGEISQSSLATPQEVITSIFYLFSSENVNKEENKKRIETIIRFIANSKIIGEVLKSNLLVSNIEIGLASLCTNYNLPLNINYANRYNSNGELIEYGELYNLLSAIEALALDETNSEILLSFIENGNPDDTMLKVKDLFARLNETKFKGRAVIEYATDSTVVNSILTNIVYNLELPPEVKIYQDDEVLIRYSNNSYIIEKEEFKVFSSKIFGVLDLLDPLINDYSNESIVSVLENKELLSYFDSKIIAGTITDTALNFLANSESGIVVPEETKADEAYKLISLIQNEKYQIDINALLNGDISSFVNLLEKEDSFDDLYSSVILSATISNALNNIIKDYEYSEVINNSMIYDNKKLSYHPEEIKSMINSLKIFDISISRLINDNSFVIDEIQNKLLKIKEEELNQVWNSYLVSGIISKQVEDSLNNVISEKNRIRDDYIFEKENNLYRFTSSELFDLKEALVNSFNIDNINNVSIDVNLFLGLYDDEKIKQTKIDYLYNSLLACYIVSEQFDKVLGKEEIGLNKQLSFSGIKEKEGDYHQYPIYQKKEMLAFLRCIRQVFGIKDEDSLNNINYVEIFGSISSDDVDLIYESNICKFIVSIKLDEIITDEYIDSKVKESSLVKEYISEDKNIYSYYKQSEIKGIIEANKELSFFSDGKFVVPTQEDLKKVDVHSLYNSSYIIKGVITNQVKTEIMAETDFIKDTSLAYDVLEDEYKGYSMSFLKEKELETMINLIDVEDTLSKLSLEEISSNLDNSSILWLSVSNYLITTENIIVVDELKSRPDFENIFIDKAEIYKLISSTLALGINNANELANISNGRVDNTKLEVIFDSLIIRSSLPKNITIKDDSKEYYLHASEEDMDIYSLNQAKYYVLKKEVYEKTFEILLDITANEDGMEYKLPSDYSKIFKYDYSSLTTPILALVSQYLASKSISINGINVSFSNYLNIQINVINLFNQKQLQLSVFGEDRFMELSKYY